MADVATEDHLGFGDQGLKRDIEIELVVFIRPDHATFAQFLDEAAEQGTIEELRRVQLLQQRQALGGEETKILQFRGRQCVATVADQQGDGDVVALDGLQEAVRKRSQAECGIALTWRALKHAAIRIGGEQAALDEEWLVNSSGVQCRNSSAWMNG